MNGFSQSTNTYHLIATNESPKACNWPKRNDICSLGAGMATGLLYPATRRGPRMLLEPAAFIVPDLGRLSKD
jgi:hypothetical protein